MDTETISAFVFIFVDSFVVCALQDLGGYAIPAKITSSCIWVAIPVNWVILHWYACGADGRLVAWAVGRSVGVWSRARVKCVLGARLKIFQTEFRKLKLTIP